MTGVEGAGARTHSCVISERKGDVGTDGPVARAAAIGVSAALGRSANSDPLRVGRDAAGSSPGRVAGLDIAGCLKYFPCRKSGRHRAIGVAAGFV